MFSPTASIWLYGVGLASFALATAAYRYRFTTSLSSSQRLAGKWLVGGFILLGLSEWSDLVVAFVAAGRFNPVVMPLAALSAVCFLEAGLAVQRSKKLTQLRWLYAVLLLGAATAITGRTAESGYIVRCCLNVAVTLTVFVAYHSFRMVDGAVQQPRSFGDAAVLAGLAIVGSVFLLGNLYQLHGVRGIGLTVVAILAIVAEFRQQPSAQASFTRRRLALPAAFAALLVAGWAVAAFAPSMERPNRAVMEVLVELEEEEVESGRASKSPKWLNAATLAVTPPAVLVAIVWLLSRLQATTKRPAARA